MKRLVHLSALVIILLTSTATFAAAHTKRTRAATCVGAATCRACKNCRYCKHCAKNGGTCGVCKRRRGAGRTWRQASEEAAAR